METNREKKNGISKKSIITLIAAVFTGFFCGFAVTHLNLSLDDRGISLADRLPVIWRAIYPYLMTACFIASILFAIVMFRRYLEIRRLLKAADPENEELLDEIQRKTSRAGVWFSVGEAFWLLFTSFGTYHLELNMRDDIRAQLSDLLPPVFFFLCMIVAIFMYKRLLDIEMALNPGRKGDFLSLFFHKQWEKTSDEAQKKILYEAGYRAFIVMLHVALVCDVIAVLSMGLFRTGLFPCLLMFAVILAGQWTFTKIQYRLEQDGWKE